MKQKVLFIDRDGTLIKEPPVDYQVDSLEKLEFLPGVFRNLYQLRQTTDYQLVIVSNQDGLGSKGYPMENYTRVQDKFIQAFKNEGIEFDEILIDPSMPEDNSPDRKPGTGMVKNFMEGGYDLQNSYVIGDRLTDLELAKNMGTKGILVADGSQGDAVQFAGLGKVCMLVSDQWDEIYRFIRASLRSSNVTRRTGETDIRIDLALDGTGKADISTGLGFFDHMLDQIARHGQFDVGVQVDGDLHVDEHHTVEDTALALGEAFLRALGNKKGLQRYGFTLPMDDSLASVAVDFGGRPWLVWEADFKREKVGDVPTELFFHFFKSFSDTAKCNLNIKAEGSNEHHKIEAIFKAFSKALRHATSLDISSDQLPSTKGTL